MSLRFTKSTHCNFYQTPFYHEKRENTSLCMKIAEVEAQLANYQNTARVSFEKPITSERYHAKVP
jgi:hypothetical protein